jgi:hypothetical protein
VLVVVERYRALAGHPIDFVTVVFVAAEDLWGCLDEEDIVVDVQVVALATGFALVASAE